MAAARSAIDNSKAEASAAAFGAAVAKKRARAVSTYDLIRAKTLVPRFQLRSLDPNKRGVIGNG